MTGADTLGDTISPSGIACGGMGKWMACGEVGMGMTCGGVGMGMVCGGVGKGMACDSPCSIINTV